MCKYIYKYLLINNLGGYIEKQFGIILFIQKEIFIINNKETKLFFIQKRRKKKAYGFMEQKKKMGYLKFEMYLKIKLHGIYLINIF